MKKIPALVVGAVTCFAAVACTSEQSSGKHQIDADYATYASVEELTEGSAGAFSVKIDKIVSRECDDGGDAEGHGGEPTNSSEEDTETDTEPSPNNPGTPPEGIEGGDSPYADCLPMRFYEATVEAVILQPEAPVTRGPDPVPLGKLIVGNVDTEAVDMEGASPLTIGSHMVVYAEKLAEADHPGIDSVKGDLWMPLGGEQGLFDVDGNTATARSSVVTSLYAGGSESDPAKRDGKFTTDLEALKQVAQNRS
ncbi:hypothetical protein AB0P17_36130 [Streptomyces sp. NPDC088124]|uniref:hypothetical protein n=1 Tax=Streptomyces sp. NPDC088124 TaxID=3154654 RepID=UPI0034265422